MLSPTPAFERSRPQPIFTSMAPLLRMAHALDGGLSLIIRYVDCSVCNRVVFPVRELLWRSFNW